ncbi:proteasome core particle subunit beta 1 [Ascoidea rubescens DSM 1968]|uniref:proteasome endopeptidase complex n=1 Tax=Ascoidea rubescens DSM 1968 TaxID=1344418 RepID=A0A1D2VNX8_9ASCO|nr:proteasome-domain-containing protein [Ascoidea rubescens DSM 1968]ODV63299.1 proteasome-domain-containing protein [Ascoidea rubescens DSM 1968]
MNGISVDINHLKKGEVNLGTSIMAVTFKDGVILGADSRTTTGSYIANRVTDKLTQVHNKIWCCRSGSAADTQAIADIVTYYLSLHQAQLNFQKGPSVKDAASIFQELCYTNKDRLTAGIICAGYNESTGKGEVYSIPLGGSLHKQNFSIAGSGSSYIYGYCNEHFKKDMEKDEAINFVKHSLAQAIKWDGSSGGVIRMVLLTKDDIERLIFFPEETYLVPKNHEI